MYQCDLLCFDNAYFYLTSVGPLHHLFTFNCSPFVVVDGLVCENNIAIMVSLGAVAGLLMSVA